MIIRLYQNDENHYLSLEKLPLIVLIVDCLYNRFGEDEIELGIRFLSEEGELDFFLKQNNF